MSVIISIIAIAHFIEVIDIASDAVSSHPVTYSSQASVSSVSERSFEDNMRSIALGKERCYPLECVFRTAVPKHLDDAKSFIAKGWVVEMESVPGTSGSLYHQFRLTAVGANNFARK